MVILRKKDVSFVLMFHQLRAASLHLLGSDPEDTILNAFKVFDPEGKGTLNKD